MLLCVPRIGKFAMRNIEFVIRKTLFAARISLCAGSIKKKKPWKALPRIFFNQKIGNNVPAA